MSRSRLKWAIGVVSAIALGGILAFWIQRGQSRALEKEPEKFRIAMDVWAGYYPVILADELGLLKKYNIEAEFQFPEDTHRMIGDFAANRYDAICVSLGDVILTTRIDPDIRLVLCSDESSGADQILGDPAMIKEHLDGGLKISTTLGGFGELFVRRYVSSLNLDQEKVSVVNGDAAAAVDLLKRHEVDACHTWEPYASQARAENYSTLYDSSATKGLILDGLVVHTSLIKNRPQALRNLASAWFEAVDWWLNPSNSAKGNALISARLKALRAPDTQVVLQGIALKNRAANVALFDPHAAGSLHESSQEYINYFLARGTLGTKLAPYDVIDSTLIK